MLKYSVQEARNEQSKEYGRKKLIKIKTYFLKQYNSEYEWKFMVGAVKTRNWSAAVCLGNKRLLHREDTTELFLRRIVFA